MSELDTVDWNQYDFIDLGCSVGGSLKACASAFGVQKGVGIELDPKKVSHSRERGGDVIQADALKLDVSNVVQFVSACDFLEHLPSLEAVEKVLKNARNAATDFLYISHPSFEGEHYLRSVGLTQYWHNWSGHKAHITISDYCALFANLGLHNYSIEYVERIGHSGHPSIIPSNLPRNQGPYEERRHGVRPEIGLHEPIWRSQRIFVALRPFSTRDWQRVVTAWSGR